MHKICKCCKSLSSFLFADAWVITHTFAMRPQVHLRRAHLYCFLIISSYLVLFCVNIWEHKQHGQAYQPLCQALICKSPQLPQSIMDTGMAMDCMESCVESIAFLLTWQDTAMDCMESCLESIAFLFATIVWCNCKFVQEERTEEVDVIKAD